MVSKDRADLLLEVSRLAQENARLMQEKADVEQELARKREQEHQPTDPQRAT